LEEICESPGKYEDSMIGDGEGEGRELVRVREVKARGGSTGESLLQCKLVRDDFGGSDSSDNI